MAKAKRETATLQTWERPYLAADNASEYQAAGVGQPELFYIAYGQTDRSAPLSRSVYRSEGLPPGIQAMAYGPAQRPEVVATFRDGYLWEQLVQAEPQAAARVAECTHCVMVRGAPEDATTLNYLRDVIGVLTYMLDRGACAIFDPWRFTWWTPEGWKRDIFQPEVFPGRHVVILTSEEPKRKTRWFHTRGMRKFGRPDISVRRVGPAYETAVADLCSRFIEYQALGGVIAEGEAVRMKSLPPGGTACHGGDLDDPDFNNVHVEIVWPKPGLTGKR